MSATMRDTSSDRRYASRKFLLACMAFVSGLVFLLFARITPEQWITFTQWIIGLYMAGNVGDTVAEGLIS